MRTLLDVCVLFKVFLGAREALHVDTLVILAGRIVPLSLRDLRSPGPGLRCFPICRSSNRIGNAMTGSFVKSPHLESFNRVISISTKITQKHESQQAIRIPDCLGLFVMFQNRTALSNLCTRTARAVYDYVHYVSDETKGSRLGKYATEKKTGKNRTLTKSDKSDCSALENVKKGGA